MSTEKAHTLVLKTVLLRNNSHTIIHIHPFEVYNLMTSATSTKLSIHHHDQCYYLCITSDRNPELPAITLTTQHCVATSLPKATSNLLFCLWRLLFWTFHKNGVITCFLETGFFHMKCFQYSLMHTTYFLFTAGWYHGLQSYQLDPPFPYQTHGF
jgi:hypothetical protein